MFACVGECVNNNKGLHLFNGEMSVWEYAALWYINCYLYRASILLCRHITPGCFLPESGMC